MGMQCHFSLHADDKFERTSMGATLESGDVVHAHLCYRSEDDIEAERWCYWFDVGSFSTYAVDNLRVLVRNRICFSCS